MLEDKSVVEMHCSESLIDISMSFFQNILASFGLKWTGIVGPGRFCCTESMCKRLSLHKTEGIKAYRLQLEKIIKYSLTRVNPKDSLSAEKLLTTFSRGWSQVFYILFRREYFQLAKDRENGKFLWLMELIIWKVHIWTDAIGNLEMKPNKCTQDVFWRNLATWKKKAPGGIWGG